MESIIVSGLQQGLIYGFMALGVLLTFELLGFPDLSVEGTFPLGAAVTARAVVEGTDPLLAVFMGAVAGGIAGAATGLMHTKLKINNILAGILTATAIYTVMLRTMGRPNTPLLAYDNVFGRVLGWFGLVESHISIILFLALLVLAARLFMGWFLSTDLGLAVRATGSNERMIRALGVNTDTTKLLALVLSNFLVGLSGALACQAQGFADVGMGIGVLVAAIASVIIGETLFGKTKLSVVLTGVILGSIVYRAVLATALRVGLPAEDFKLITAVLVLLALTLPRFSFRGKSGGLLSAKLKGAKYVPDRVAGVGNREVER